LKAGGKGAGSRFLGVLRLTTPAYGAAELDVPVHAYAPPVMDAIFVERRCRAEDC
jgi:hypothetical protein